LDDLAFLVGEWIVVALEGDVLSERDRLAIHEQPGEHPAGYERSGEHADRTGERARPSHDPLPWHRDQITARACSRAHGDHQWLALRDHVDRLPHRLRRRPRASAG